MISKDGFYINHYSGRNQYNESVEITTVLYFTKNDLVLFINKKGILSPENISKDILNKDFGFELTKELGKYEITGNKIKIVYPLKDISRIENEYQEFKGQINGNNLMLDYINCCWNEIQEDYHRKTLVSNLNFKFYSIIENRYIDKEPEIKSTIYEKFDSNISNIPESKIEEIKKYNKNRNGAIAFFFGFVGALVGVVFSGFSGFLIGAIIGVVIGFALKSILD